MHSSFEPLTITSATVDKTSRFTGYAYVSADIVVGQDGYETWSRVHSNASLPGHQDGCYMTAMYRNDEWEVSGDFKGYCKLFVYQHGNYWGFSNSFSSLLEEVRSQGWPITPDESQIDMWLPTPTFWQQLPTFNTAVQEIELLPRQAVLTASPSGISWQTTALSSSFADRDSFTNGLQEYVRSWVSRMLTVLENEHTQLELELTGGRDSRTALALALGAKQMVSANVHERMTVRSSKTQPIDLECAENISKNFGLRFNKPLPSLGQPQVRLDPYERWRQFALGSYGPISLPPASIRSGVFKVGGHGGEGHRSYYTYDALESPVYRHAGFRSDAARSKFLLSIQKTTEALTKEYPGIDLMTAHYKEFRDRIHGGLHSMHHVRMQPLASNLLEDTMRFSRDDERDRGQVLYDIIGVLTPALLMVPFETKDKAPGAEILSQLIKPFSINAVSGQIYGSTPARVEQRGDLSTLLDAFYEADRELPSDAVTTQTRSQARKLADSLREGEATGHGRNIVAIHQILLAHTVNG